MASDRAPDLPALPRDEAGAPVLQAPWEAQAFAMAVRLHDPDRGDTYHRHWLAALEGLVAEKGLIGADELRTRKAEWEAEVQATPHGLPIELHRGQAGGRG